MNSTYFSGTKLCSQQCAIISFNCDCHLDYYTDVNWAPWYPATWLFAHEFVQINARENIKVLLWWKYNVQRWIPAQRDCHAETVSTISWHHDGYKFYRTFQDDIVGTLVKRVGHITVKQNTRNIRWATFNKARKWINLELIEVKKAIHFIRQRILFSRCVFVCLFLFVWVFVCHDICPDDLTMKNWCNSNNILQEYKGGDV